MLLDFSVRSPVPQIDTGPNMLTEDLIERLEMYREIMGKGVKKGVAEGMEDSIVSVLITRFGEIPDRLAQRIHHIRDNTVLKDMLK